MEKRDVISFFDNLAAGWDAEQIPKDVIIEKILDNGGVEEGKDILDIACGTGTLFPFYFERKVNSVTGIDISPEMTKIAKEKFPEIKVICGDAEEYRFDKKFDIIMIYNAFPHFPNPEKLIKHIAGYLNDGGRLTVAHSMSREEIQSRHEKRAAKVSLELPTAEDLSEMLKPYFEIDIMISDNEMYQVSGIKK
ncbi:MAG: class I SAM-dependent methyltransferase [Ruminococcaceae bacterium]|nr:class I SAM-dependent methyltransferase [Oscillospiraceae bacterium]